MTRQTAPGRYIPGRKGEPMKEYAVYYKDRDGVHIAGHFNSSDLAFAAAKMRRRTARTPLKDVCVVERNVTDWTLTKGGRVD